MDIYRKGEDRKTSKNPNSSQGDEANKKIWDAGRMFRIHFAGLFQPENQ